MTALLKRVELIILVYLNLGIGFKGWTFTLGMSVVVLIIFNISNTANRLCD